MKKITYYLSLFIIFSCANESEITIKKFEGSPEFQEATLSLNSFDMNEIQRMILVLMLKIINWEIKQMEQVLMV